MIIPLALLAALALPGATPRLEPASLPVNIAGKPPAVLRADILSASQAVCRATPGDAYGPDDCVAATYDAAMQKVRLVLRAQARPLRSASLIRP